MQPKASEWNPKDYQLQYTFERLEELEMKLLVIKDPGVMEYKVAEKIGAMLFSETQKECKETKKLLNNSGFSEDEDIYPEIPEEDKILSLPVSLALSGKTDPSPPPVLILHEEGKKETDCVPSLDTKKSDSTTGGSAEASPEVSRPKKRKAYLDVTTVLKGSEGVAVTL